MAMQLKSYLEKRGLKAADFAAQVGASEGGIYKILNGQRHASLALAAQIELVTGGQVRWSEVTKPVPEGWAITKRKVADRTSQGQAA